MPYLKISLKLESDFSEMHVFQLESCEMCTFQLDCTKTADIHSNLLVFWELVTVGYQRIPKK